MSVQNEIDRINNNIANTYATLNEAGATMPETRNSNNLSATAASISAVLFNKAQNLTAAQQQQARDNIGISSESIPAYVKTEADAVIARVMDAQTSGRVFTLAAIADMHYGSGENKDGVNHAASAIKYIDKRIKIDALNVHGDYTDKYVFSNYEEGIADITDVNGILADTDADMLTIVGNHDFHVKNSPQIACALSMKSENVVWGSKVGGYYYRDFTDNKLRFIAINTSETDGGNNGICCSDAQYAWFINTLDLSAKEDAAEWQILIASHHPLDWYEKAGDGVYRFAHIINAYEKGASWSGGGLSCDYAGKNTARIVCNVHSHLHNLLMDKIRIGNPDLTTDTCGVTRMCLPESCFDRPQSYAGAWEAETTYLKVANTASETAFQILCIDLDNYTVKAINYGAGIDRTLVYYDPSAPKYTNVIPLAIGSDGKPFNGGKGWISGYRLNSSAAQVSNADYCVTGFIPIKNWDYLYLKDMNLVIGSLDTQPNTRVALYNADFSMRQISTTDTILEKAHWGGYNGYILNEAGGAAAMGDTIGRLRIVNDGAAYIRFSTKKIDDTSVVTVNEPIE